VRGFADRDLDGIIADYSADALFFNAVGALRGLGCHQTVFAKMFGEFANLGRTQKMDAAFSQESSCNSQESPTIIPRLVPNAGWKSSKMPGVAEGIVPHDEPITILLQRFARGDKQALDRLMALVYSELQRMAADYLRNERSGHTLQPTALVHEAYARLVKQDRSDYEGRAHFMGVAPQGMPQILIDHARTRNAAKHGSGEVKLSLDQAGEIAVHRPSILVAIDHALQELARKDAAEARLIEMRFFGGLTAEESAKVTRGTSVPANPEIGFCKL
jgi:RNA polymerase sigma factor (TIGR02999 family)